jgi:hypothetical protein
MRRLKIPEPFINLITGLLTQRKLQIDTPYGIAEQFTPTRGLPQGDTISPLLWTIFYDPLLCRLENETKGFPITNDNYITAAAFADDIHPMSSEPSDLQDQLAIISEFLAIHDMKMRPSKCKVTSTLPNIPVAHRFIINGEEITQRLKNKDLIRLLGVHWTMDGNYSQTFDKAMKSLGYCINKLQWKYTPGKIAVELINTVVIPRIAYQLQLLPIPKTKIEHLEAQIRKIARTKLGGTKSKPTNSILTDSRTGYRVNSVEQRLKEAAISSLNTWLQRNDIINKAIQETSSIMTNKLNKYIYRWNVRLQSFPCVRLDLDQPSIYGQLKREPDDSCVCTGEAVAHTMSVLDDRMQKILPVDLVDIVMRPIESIVQTQLAFN